MSAPAGTSPDFEQFRITFFEECAELLADLDARLARLTIDEADREPLNAIFRAVHSIKAGAGAFGYGALVEFAHRLEAVLDRLRDGAMAHTTDVSDLLVRAGDVLASLVEAAQAGRAPAPELGEEVMAELALLLAAEAPVKVDSPASAARAPSEAGAAAATPCRYRITFKPHAEMFRHANEPLLLFRELRQLGSLAVECDQSRLPVLEALDPEGAYLAWTMELETAEPRARIAEVFEFVEDDCELSIELLPAAAGGGAGAAAPPAASAAAESAIARHGSPPIVPGGPIAAPEMPAPAHGRPRAGEEAERARAPAPASIRVELARIDRLVNMVGELVITQSMLAEQIAGLGPGKAGQAVKGHEDLALLTRELQECVMAIRMQPVKSVFSRMPRLVREVSAKLGKSVRLAMSGELTEVDKTVIEELADPLTHMLRNAIDHGIESPEARLAAGKPAEGTIELSALHAGSNILIHVADDGRGIDRERLVAKAVAKGIVPAGAPLSEEEVYDLLFAPGFSTAERVTDVSGRGVGMDVVRRNIVNLGGRIQVQSVPGRGTRFTLVIPLTLAVLDGMIVAVGRERYILPITSILESYRPDRRSLRVVTGGVQVAAVRGEYVRLVHLHRLFGVAGAVADPADGLVVLVETAQGGKAGIVVDELIGQQQVVIKSLAENFDPVQGVSGATILGNGRLALILDIEELSRMAAPPVPALSRPHSLQAA